MFNNLDKKDIKRELETDYVEYTRIEFIENKFGTKYYNKHIKNNSDINAFKMSNNPRLIYVKAMDFSRLKFANRDLRRIKNMYTELEW